MVASYRDKNFLVSTFIERTFLHDSVKRTEVSEGLVKGALFIPAGRGPYPSLVDVSGRLGGVSEERAALLAKEGFLTLAVNLTEFKRPDQVPADLVSQAADFLAARADAQGVGVTGANFGIQMCLSGTLKSDKIDAAVCIGSPGILLADSKVGLDVETQEIVDGKLMFKLDAKVRLPRFILDGTSRKTPILFVFGEFCPGFEKSQIKEVAEQLKKSGGSVVLEEIPGEGGIIDPPFTPLCVEWTPEIVSEHSLGRNLMSFGGRYSDHEGNQLEAWKRMLEFLRSHLCPRPSTLKAKI